MPRLAQTQVRPRVHRDHACLLRKPAPDADAFGGMRATQLQFMCLCTFGTRCAYITFHGFHLKLLTAFALGKYTVTQGPGMWRNLTPYRLAFMLSLIVSNHVLLIGLAGAVSSRLCLDIVAKLQEGVDSGRITKCRPLCGPLGTNSYNISFMDRLSPSCKAVMSRYKGSSIAAVTVSSARSANQTSHRVSPPVHGCRQIKQASAATNPVVVEIEDATNFVMCTVPKAGCTLLRSLLFALTRGTQGSVSFRNSAVHDTSYPTAWHYTSELDLLDTYPTFVVGRNPYIRLVSGFLDKMVVSKQSHDWVVMERVISDLGVPKHARFKATKKSFSSFVHLLKMSPHRNSHFDTAVNVCYMSHFPYRYKLRIEDMSEWYPCWSSGLRLDPLTRTGWNRTSAGFTAFNASGTSCWWAPGKSSCAEYSDRTHSENGDAIVANAWKAGATTHAYDPHDTRSAEKWQAFYDQETADIVYHLYKEDFDEFGYERLVL